MKNLKVNGIGDVELSLNFDDDNQQYYEVKKDGKFLAILYTNEEFGSDFFMIDLESAIEAYN